MSVAHLCLTLRSHECSPPGTPVYEILQVKILEWVTILFNSWNLTEGKSVLRLFSSWRKDRLKLFQYLGIPGLLCMWSLVGCLMIRFTNVLSFVTGLHVWCPCSDPLVAQSPISTYYPLNVCLVGNGALDFIFFNKRIAIKLNGIFEDHSIILNKGKPWSSKQGK